MEEFVDDRNPSPREDPPVTAVASRQVKPGREREFEEWVSGILATANEFLGYLGSEVLRPSDPDDNEYKIVFRFDHASNLHAWENSEERQRWLRKSRPLLHEEEKVARPHGPRDLVHAALQGRGSASSPLQDGHRHLACGFPDRVHNLLRFRPVAEPASHAAAHAGLYGGDGHADDLRHHAPHDAPVLLLALPGSQLMKNRE